MVNAAYTPGAVLNDPLAEELLAQARRSVNGFRIVENLLSVEKIFGLDLPANEVFTGALVEKFIELSANSAVATCEQIRFK